MNKLILPAIVSFTILFNNIEAQSLKKEYSMFRPLSYEEADAKADSVLKLMTLDEKMSYIVGDRGFFIRPIPRLNLKEVYMADATQGVHIRKSFKGADLADYQLEKSTAFPCPILLASTWNLDLSYKYAEAIGEECIAGNVGILLGPGMNSYRQSQCGRNFEYFGEDPFLRSRMIEGYVKGLQSTGTIATLKHFVANNTEFYRRKSNSVVDERTLHEIYVPPFKAGIDAGAKAVMTSYNLLNGEWTGQSDYAVNDLLRNQLGFQWLVMTDWWSVYDGEKCAKSGQDLEMPVAIALKDLDDLVAGGKVKIQDIDRMTKSILRTYFAMKLDKREKNNSGSIDYEAHELVALQTAREGIVLLKNEKGILPLNEDVKTILLTGKYVENIAAGGGAAAVEGYNKISMLDALKKEFGTKIVYLENPTVEQIKKADIVLYNVGTSDNEGWDRPFELPEDQERKVEECVNNNPNTIVIVTSGSGIRMTEWRDNAKSIIYAWYGGQNGNKALAEIISGKTNPSGKLPITIEKDFKDSPAHGYIPKGEELYSDWNGREEQEHPVYDIVYEEGIFVGYRWYEKKNINPLYPFGHGLSYTTFEYSDILVSKEKFGEKDNIKVTFKIKNSGKRHGSEIAQLYICDIDCSLPRPLKELKGFKKVDIEPGKTIAVSLVLSKKDFSFWNPKTKDWFAEKGKFIIQIGSSSKDIRLSKEVEMK